MTPAEMKNLLARFQPALYAPNSICREVFMGLLERDPTKRFDLNDLKTKQAFEIFGWQRLEGQEFQPPIRPQMKNLEFIEKKVQMESVLFGGNPKPHLPNFNHEPVFAEPAAVNQGE